MLDKYFWLYVAFVLAISIEMIILGYLPSTWQFWLDFFCVVGAFVCGRVSESEK